MRCIIIEDQLPAQRILKKYIQNHDALSLEASFTSAISALSFLEEENIDLIFLDIHLPKLSGLDFLRKLTKNHRKLLINSKFLSNITKSTKFYEFIEFSAKLFINRLKTSKNLKN